MSKTTKQLLQNVNKEMGEMTTAILYETIITSLKNKIGDEDMIRTEMNKPGSLINGEWYMDEVKKLYDYFTEKENKYYYQPEFNERVWDECDFMSFMIYTSYEEAKKEFPELKIMTYMNDDIENPTYVDEN